MRIVRFSLHCICLRAVVSSPEDGRFTPVVLYLSTRSCNRFKMSYGSQGQRTGHLDVTDMRAEQSMTHVEICPVN